jgi:mannose-6-phosphate isomerase-like protein (cupin superfamily)
MGRRDNEDPLRGSTMRAFDLDVLLAERERAGKAWLEFLRVPSLSMGVYHLEAEQEDRQQPHTEDEVYYVVAGRAKFRAGDEVKVAGPGSILFVERLVEHRFFDITENLTVLVFFAPAEGSQQGQMDPGRS